MTYVSKRARFVLLPFSFFELSYPTVSKNITNIVNVHITNIIFHTFTYFSYISTPLYTPKPQKPMKNTWFFNYFANPTFSVFYLSCTKFTSIFTYFTSNNTSKSPLGPKLAPQGPRFRPPWPSCDHLGTPFRLLGATSGPLGAPFLLPWPILEPFLLTLEPNTPSRTFFL